MNIIRKPCAAQNFRAGRQGHVVEKIVIHVVDGGIAGCDATFASPSLELRRSAHYCVAKNGSIHQYVEEQDTAFHAGRVQGPTVPLKTLSNGTILNPNLYTIGIEHEGRATDEWQETQIKTSAELLAAISSRYPALHPLNRSNVIMHREIFSGKTCPGFKVDLADLIARANGQSSVPVVSIGTAIRIVKPVRVRDGAAATTAPSLRILPPSGTPVQPIREVQGEAVQGISRWYEIAANEFIWGGAAVVV